MLSKLKQSKSEGFTIIEVMIVLAIAALIILIVLLAVPALQRSSRNTAIKNDASAIAAAIGEFGSNNDGGQPTAAASAYNPAGSAQGTLSLNNATGTATTGKLQASDTVALQQASVASVTPAAGQLTIDFGAKCPTVVTGATVTPVASTRSTAIIYAVEQNGGNQAKCLES
jgi:prepilin-type N-terminal cleavage/methylation domain-containing protein